MKYFVNLILILVAISFATSSFGQTLPTKEVSIKNIGPYWAKGVELNMHLFPNPDSVVIGDTIPVYLEKYRMLIVADSHVNSQYAAYEEGLRRITENHIDSTKLDVVPQKNTEEGYSLGFLVPLLIVVVTLSFFFLYQALKKNEDLKAEIQEKKEEEKKLEPEVVQGPPILEHVPDFDTATQTEINFATEEAIANTFHKKFERVGDTKKGKVIGLEGAELIVFFADGSHTVEKLKNGRKGYVTDLLFEGSSEPDKVFWDSTCFNPFWNAIGAELNIIFEVEKTGEIIVIGEISKERIKEVSHSITMPEEEIDMEELLADQPVPSLVSSDRQGEVTKISSLGDNKVIIEGSFLLTKENNEIVSQLVALLKKPDNK